MIPSSPKPRVVVHAHILFRNQSGFRNEEALTICAGFKFNYGIVLCADSQETVGDMKFDAPKLVIRPTVGDPDDELRMMFAGAGDAAFIDNLVDRIWQTVKKNPQRLD